MARELRDYNLLVAGDLYLGEPFLDTRDTASRIAIVARAHEMAVPLFAALLVGCAGPGRARTGEPDLSFVVLQARLAARAASLAGHVSEFRVGAEQFNADCSGFVEAVYEAEGIPLRAMARRAAPRERSGVAALYEAMAAHGALFGGGEWPAPGDLVFFDDTYGGDRGERAGGRLTHVGIVEYVVNGTVVFIHRGGRAVVRGAMNTRRPTEKSEGGILLNTPVRARSPGGQRAGKFPVLAGALFAAYGRVDPGRLPPPVELAAR